MLRALLLVAAAASAAKPKNQLFRPAGPRGPRRPHPPLRPISAAPASTAAPRPEVETVVDDDDFRRPAVDGRRYRLVRLRNGLEAVLVSDADADEAGAALSVRAGSFDDTLMGLAHFHEHMLFLGTEKYPGEDEYEKRARRADDAPSRRVEGGAASLEFPLMKIAATPRLPRGYSVETESRRRRGRDTNTGESRRRRGRNAAMSLVNRGGAAAATRLCLW